jgi:DNA replication and repair protein RecF
VTPPAPATTAPAGVARVALRHFAARDFRNIRRLVLDLPAEGIAVVGENGHGKTNLLEGIYYLELLRSVRGARDADLVRFGAAGFHVAARLASDREHEIAAGFERATKRKRVTVDGGEAARLSDAIGMLPSVFVSPRDVALVAGGPSERRRFLDIVLALSSRAYLTALQGYRAALLRRNAALREAARAGADAARVAVWEPALAEHGAVIWLERVRWVDDHAERFAALCASIGERGVARMRYVSHLGVAAQGDARGDGRAGAVPPAVGDVRAALASALAERRAVDLRRGVTHAGPHRDDLELTLAGPDGGPRELRAFGSAGQQRTAAIALRMLEAETLRARSRGEPLLLLDDPFAELDARRAVRVLDLFVHEGLGQVILAVPRAGDIPPGLTGLERWQITDGALARSS